MRRSTLALVVRKRETRPATLSPPSPADRHPAVRRAIIGNIRSGDVVKIGMITLTVSSLRAPKWFVHVDQLHTTRASGILSLPCRKRQTRLRDAPPRSDHSLRYRSEEHTSELQSRENLVCRLLLEK